MASTSLQKAMAALKKNKKVDFSNRVELDTQTMTSIPAISTGSMVVDYIIGGNRLPNGQHQCPGIPRGRITEIFGPEGSGKTTLALETAVSCQKLGGTVCFLDYENAISPSYAQSLGLSFAQDKFELFSPTTWEEGAEIIKAMVLAGVDMIIVDSVSAMVPQASFEKDPSDTAQIGLLARLQSGFLPNLVGDLRRSNTALIYLNQLRSRVKTNKYDAGPEEDTSGGRALKYYCSLRLELKKVKTEYENVHNPLLGQKEKQPICNIVRVRCVKNKVSMHQGHNSTVALRYGQGFDDVRSVIDISEAKRVIRRSGAWYKFVDETGAEQAFQGKEALRNYLLTKPSTMQYLANAIASFSSTDLTSVPESDDDVIQEVYDDVDPMDVDDDGDDA